MFHRSAYRFKQSPDIATILRMYSGYQYISRNWCSALSHSLLIVDDEHIFNLKDKFQGGAFNLIRLASRVDNAGEHFTKKYVARISYQPEVLKQYNGAALNVDKFGETAKPVYFKDNNFHQAIAQVLPYYPESLEAWAESVNRAHQPDCRKQLAAAIACLNQLLIFHKKQFLDPNIKTYTHYVHRDIKSSNFVIKRETNDIALIDFDFACPPGKTKQLIGTPYYMAPEALDGEVRQESDYYSIAAVLAQVLGDESFMSRKISAQRAANRYLSIAHVVHAPYQFNLNHLALQGLPHQAITTLSNILKALGAQHPMRRKKITLQAAISQIQRILAQLLSIELQRKYQLSKQTALHQAVAAVRNNIGHLSTEQIYLKTTIDSISYKAITKTAPHSYIHRPILPAINLDKKAEKRRPAAYRKPQQNDDQLKFPALLRQPARIDKHKVDGHGMRLRNYKKQLRDNRPAWRP